MKLELKHLAPYLPYKLKFLILDHRVEPWTMYPSNMDFIIANYKPILRPLSDLTKEIEHNGEKVDVLEEIYSDSWMACGYIVKERKTFIEIISKEDSSVLTIDLTKPQCNEVWVNEILIKYHFDTKFLIKEGLAIDINTIKET